uniref:Uncharacterized protein n=1 Tax=Romanomermis culicivorax TaxID=13658 RepID=A0A915HQF4_ROMCU
MIGVNAKKQTMIGRQNPPLAPAATLAPAEDHRSSLAIANANECHHDCEPSPDQWPQDLLPVPAKLVSFQQPQPRTEILLEQLIQRWDRDCKERQSWYHPEKYQHSTRDQPPQQHFQPCDTYHDCSDCSASQDCPHPAQYQPTGLWHHAYKSGTHNTKDCIWLKRQNAQRNQHHDQGRPPYAMQLLSLDFRSNSNDVHGQCKWRL